MFLTPAELYTLTGKKTPSAQLKVLPTITPHVHYYEREGVPVVPSAAFGAPVSYDKPKPKLVRKCAPAKR